MNQAHANLLVVLLLGTVAVSGCGARKGAHQAAGAPGSSAANSETPDRIRAGVRARLPEIKACYEAALSANPTLAGTLQASFDLDATGAVIAAQAAGLEPGVDACVTAAIRTVKVDLPAGAGAQHVTAYPIAFAPGAEPAAGAGAGE